MIHPRVLAVAALGALFTIAIGAVQGPEGRDPRGIPRETFWLHKLTAPARYDVVFIGDSRVLCDIATGEVDRVLSGRTALNFGFNYVGLAPDYYAASEAKLRPRASGDSVRAIVVGVTPRALTPLNARVSGYREERDRPREEVVFNRLLPGAMTFLRPIYLGSAVQRWVGKVKWERNMFSDGWMSVDLAPTDSNVALSEYEDLFTGNQVSPALQDSLIMAVRQWRAKGIRVYGYRPPTIPLMVRLEDTKSGWNETEFARRFTDAGGIWFDVREPQRVVIDGSHLRDDAARAFSRDLAQRMAGTLP